MVAAGSPCCSLAAVADRRRLGGDLRRRAGRRPPAAELPTIAAHLAAHPGRPAAAWPPGLRRSIPAPAAFYVTGAMVAGLLAGLAAIGLRAAVELGFDEASAAHRRERAPSSRWASVRDLRALRVAEPVPGRLTLGRVGRRLLAAEERAVGDRDRPDRQSHKTTGLAIPALLEWQGPVLATSVKSDLLRDTLARRRSARRGDGLRPGAGRPASPRRARRRSGAPGPGAGRCGSRTG